MESATTAFLFLLAFTTQAYSQETLAEPSTQTPDSTLADTSAETDLLSNSSGIPAEKLYHYQWDNTNIRYKAGEFSHRKEPIEIVLENDSTLGRYVHPFKGKVISHFGRRGKRMHTGTDVKLHLGDSVLCAFDGKVKLAKRYYGYGNMVLVRHHNGLETLYGHLSKICVKENQRVHAGDLIGLGGRTGRATTEHLHFETRFLGEPFDSEKYIDFNFYTLRADTIYFSHHTIKLKGPNSEEKAHKEEVAAVTTSRLTPEEKEGKEASLLSVSHK